MAGALGGDHGHVHVGGGHDLLEVDVEAVGKHQHVARLQVGSDVPLVHVGLDLVVDQDHHDVAPLGGLGDGHDLQPGLLGVLPVLGAGAETHAHVTAGILQVQGVGVALGAVADDGDFLTVEVVDLAVLRVGHLCHDNTLLFADGIKIQIQNPRGPVLGPLGGLTG